jgi:MarR family transcriptional regulator for hemolysin
MTDVTASDKPRAIYRPSIAREDFVFKLFRARNKMRLELDLVFKPLGVTDATWRVLFYLYKTNQDIMQKDLANELGIEGPTLVRLLDKLEEQDLIMRKPAAHDRRGKTVHLTDSAEPVISQLLDIAVSTRTRLLADISDEDLETCVSVLDRIITPANPVEQ